MRRMLCSLGGAILSLFFITSTALAWGSATHAYIADQLDKKRGSKNSLEMYSTMAPDLFNYQFGSPFGSNLYLQTHFKFMNVSDRAQTGRQKAMSAGFVSQNDLWGADSTAHHASRTLSPAEGYVVTKAAVLAAEAPLPAGLGIPADAADELYHVFVEAGVDVLTKRLDPLLGQKITRSALARSWGFPYLLSRAYAADLAVYYGTEDLARRAIFAAEANFRKMMILYGVALAQDEATTIELLAEELADLAEGFLAPRGVALPPREVVHQIISLEIQRAMALCAPDFEKELAGTITSVDQQLMLNGITD
ncbi:MAG: hypothetical protein A2X56_02610 [Nitrospirae bacterium GWC2_57_13]|nr:MAG: hypothetical protein A2X56_02610 [Nitrospirae bacterium GWC2_57_13]HAR45578.1 hypothetical protein [Nitrospiraceae bacterium]HAS53311.1 hypothetical protein [Nitrospiraceae bacterium]